MMRTPTSPGTAAPTEGAATPSGLATRLSVHADRILAAAVCAALLTKFVLITRIYINWDEFYFLELIHQYARGELAGRFQTFHVHFFSWLPGSGWDAIDQIVAGRAVLAIMAVASAFLIHAIARRFVTRGGALFALLAYLSVSAVIEHSASFRVDPIVTFLCLLSLVLILYRPDAQGAVLAGIVMALATLVTIKSVFYLAVIGGLFWCIAPSMRARAKRALAFATSFSVAGIALFLWHSAMLAPQDAPQEAARAFLGGSASKMFLDSVFPRSFDFVSMVILNPLFWLMLGEGALVAWAAARRAKSQAGWLPYLPLVLALPVLSLFFYRNAFVYFYPFILGPAALLVGFSFDKHRNKPARPNGIPPHRLAAILIALQCIILLFGIASRLTDAVPVQRQTIAEVRAIFPEPVAHIEGFGVFADYPRTGFFMSSWGVENYRQASKPIFADLVKRDQPAFVFADAPSLYGALVPGVQVTKERTFLPEDVQFLKENYVRHWGMLFVAGKHLSAPDGGAFTFDIAVTGEYRLEAGASATIDGIRMEPGSIILLAAGSHAIEFAVPAHEATLRWAKARHVPEIAPADPLTFFNRRSWGGMTAQMMQSDAVR